MSQKKRRKRTTKAAKTAPKDYKPSRPQQVITTEKLNFEGKKLWSPAKPPPRTTFKKPPAPEFSQAREDFFACQRAGKFQGGF